MDQFDRQYRFSAGKAGKQGFQVGEANPVALHISFDVQKADVQSANTAKITIWNLNPSQLAILNTKDCVVTLKAGYGNNTPLLFAGDVVRIETLEDGADRMTEIEAVDGRVAIRDTIIAISYKGIIDSKKIVEDIAIQMGLPIIVAPNTKFIKLTNGYSFVGAGRSALDKITNMQGLMWNIQNGVLQVKKQGGSISPRVFVLSVDSGLVGIVKKITIGAENGEDTVKEGYEVNCLLNGCVGTGDLIRLESKTAKGIFKIHSIEHNGDNLEGEWQSTVKIYGVK